MNREVYSRLVEQGKRLITKEFALQWEWGDLALRVAPIVSKPTSQKGIANVKLDSTLSLERWLLDIGYEGAFRTIREYRSTSFAWPKDKRVKGASWKAHNIIVSDRKRFEILKPGMTVNDTLIAASRRPNANQQGTHDEAWEYINGAARLLKRAAVVIRNDPDLDGKTLRKISESCGKVADGLDLVYEAAQIEVSID